MRSLFALAVVAAAVNLSAGMISAQEAAAPGQRMVYMPEDYESLRARIEQLEANQSRTAPVLLPVPAQGGVYAQYDNVIVTPFLSENSAFPTQDVNGNIGNYGFNFDLTYSPRIEIGYMAPTSGIGFRGRYWHFETETTAGPADDGNGLIASDAVAVVVGGQISDVDTITSVVFDLRMEVLDLEATRAVGNGTLAAGIRIASIGQKYNLDSDEGQLYTKLRSTGVGPTLAYEWKSNDVWTDGLHWIAGVRGSLLYGQKDVYSLGEENTYNYDEQSLISNVEAQLGLEYRNPGGFFLRAALEAQYWANTGNATNQNIGLEDTVDDSFVSSILDDDLGFLGMVFSVGYMW